jgi:type III secretory pathway component EscV
MLDGEQVVRATACQVSGVATLSMHRISRNNRAGDIDAVQQYREHRDFVHLGSHLHLAQDGAMGMIEGGQQVITGFAAAG